MARTKLTPQNIVRTGLAPSLSAADAVNHHSWDNTGEHMFLVVRNGAGSPITVTVDNPKAVDGLNVPDLTISVTNAQDRWIGPFPNDVYAQADSGNSLTTAILFSVSSGTSITVGVFKLAEATY